MKVDKNRFKNVYFWTALLSLIFFFLTDTGLITFEKYKFDNYVSLITTVFICAGIWINPNTPGFNDHCNFQNITF